MYRNDKAKKISLKKVICLSLRGYCLWWKNYPKMLLSALFCSIVTALTPLVKIVLISQIITEISSDKDPVMLKSRVLMLLVSTIILSIINAVLSRWKIYERKTLWYKRDKFYTDKLLSMNFCDADSSSTQNLLQKIQQNDSWPTWGLGGLIGNFDLLVESILTIVGAVAISFSLFTCQVPASAGWLTILNSPIFVVIIVLVMFSVTLAVPELINRGNAYWANYSSDITMFEKYRMFIVKSSQERKRALDTRIYRQDIMGKKYLDEAMNHGGRATTILRPMRLYHTCSTAVSYIFNLIIYIFVCLKAWGGAYDVGAIMKYIAAVISLSTGISGLLQFWGNQRNNVPFLQTVFEFLDIPNRMYNGKLYINEDKCVNYEISFYNVCFKYPSSNKYALNNITLKLTQGKRIAIVGENGSGKTTFIKLLCRLYDPTNGGIYLNGVDIRRYDYKQYMDMFSIVFQDFKLFSFSLGQNVAASEHYDADLVKDCLKKTGFEKRLKSLSKGLDTCIYKDFEQEGIDISEGEAQKIALSRALFKDAPFFILDEPTASLDPIAEFEIYEKMNDIVKDKTTIFISHRLSSCRFCDEILVFDNGTIVQHGSHRELIADKTGKYFKLWNAQAQYYTA